MLAVRGLAVDDEAPLPVVQGSFDDPRISLCPVVTASGDQPHAVAVALHPQSVAILLHFWSQSEPVGPFAPFGNAELKRLKHAPIIGIRRSFAYLLPRIGAQIAIPRWIVQDSQGRWLLSGLLAVRPFFLGRVRTGVEGNHPWRASSNFLEWIWPNLKRK